MSTWVLPAVSIIVTYLVCIRPSLRGGCKMGRDACSDPIVERQLAELRTELRLLRAQDSGDDADSLGNRPQQALVRADEHGARVSRPNRPR
ncbi:hypothetical protein ACL02T_10240 [Pseudonocardia sp. RS010]|uniref:hypothetical protein n=1 Tax=Pseudonocardia sp. RS010 TaxID=3385979 RepID=UPI0039A2BDA0